ncbi:MAG: YggS family pyridoxal phosphate-dependent enzyme [Bacteroidales bacterium]
MGKVSDNINSVKAALPDRVSLVAVSKTMPVEMISEAREAGHLVFGENRVQELTAKQPLLPADVQWHMIGHLQRNKVKYIAGFVHMIQSVDSVKLVRTINSEAEKSGRRIKILLQFHIAEEETKFGLDMKEAEEITGMWKDGALEHTEICGVMGMATFTDDEVQIRREFRSLKETFYALKKKWFESDDSFNVISMGMSGDYRIAVEEGSNMVRLGSIIFGER